MKSSKKKLSLQPTADELLYFGFGLAALAKDQLESISSVLVKEGKLLAKDRKQFKKDLTVKGRALYKKMQSEMQEMNMAILKKMNIPSRKEFEALKRQVGNKRPKK